MNASLHFFFFPFSSKFSFTQTTATMTSPKVTFAETVEQTFTPLSEDQRSLIDRYFKPNYAPKVANYIESSPQYRRNRFFKMLDFAAGNVPEQPRLTGPENDLAFNQNGGFGLTFSFHGRRSSRRSNPNRFSSPGIAENGIFGYNSNTTQFGKTLPTKSVSQVHFAVNKMIREDKVDKVLMISGDFVPIWMDLIRNVDDKMSMSQSNFRATKTAAVATRKNTFINSLRLNDPTIAELYKSDTRWNRLTFPRQ